MNKISSIAAAILIAACCGCRSASVRPADRICVINALTQQGEPDVLIAFTDRRSGEVTYGKTDRNGRAWLDVPQTGWGNRAAFDLQYGKPGFDPPMYCDYRYPDGVLPPDDRYNPSSVLCIVPAGTDRSRLKGHDHKPFAQAPQDQAELRREWEAFRDSRP